MKNHLAYKIIAVILFGVFIYYVQDSLFPVILSLILFYILNPLVDFLSKKRKNWPGADLHLSIIFAFVLTAGVISLFFRFIIPPLRTEFKHFIINIPYYIQTSQSILTNLRDWYEDSHLPIFLQNIITQGFENIVTTISNSVETAVKNILGSAGQFIKIIIVPILTYYLLKDKEQLRSGALRLLPDKIREKSKRLLDKINSVLNNYIKGMAVLCLVVGTVAAAGLKVLGVKYVLILGLLAGITEAIPIIGPWIGALPAIMIALTMDPMLALKTAILYLLIQILENAFLVPKILGHHLDLHPVAIILGMLVMGQLLGVWGLFFASPLLAIMKVVYEEFRS